MLRCILSNTNNYFYKFDESLKDLMKEVCKNKNALKNLSDRKRILKI